MLLRVGILALLARRTRRCITHTISSSASLAPESAYARYAHRRRWNFCPIAASPL